MTDRARLIGAIGWDAAVLATTLARVPRAATVASIASTSGAWCLNTIGLDDGSCVHVAADKEDGADREKKKKKNRFSENHMLFV